MNIYERIDKLAKQIQARDGEMSRNEAITQAIEKTDGIDVIIERVTNALQDFNPEWNKDRARAVARQAVAGMVQDKV